MKSRRALHQSDHRLSFPDTQWSLIVQAAGDQDSHRALEELCSKYWYPLFVFSRSRGLSVHDAEDVIQGFFVEILRRGDLRKVDRNCGKFRSFMLASLKNFIANDFRARKTEKRGGGAIPVSIDAVNGEERFQTEAIQGESPENLFERAWAYTLLEIAVSRLGAEYDRAGKSDLFRELSAFLPSAEKPPSLGELAERLGIGDSAATMKVHRMRKRFGDLLEEELRQTVSGEEDYEGELQHLFSVIGS